VEPTFTFCIISYNQENYIIEALESIKYQVKVYGKNFRTHLIVADDGSSDNTLKYAKIWIQKNSNLFEFTNIISQERNKGTVNNVSLALHAIRSDAFKLIAGDDVFTSNSCYELINLFSKADFVSCMSAAFEGDKVYFNKGHVNNYMYYRNRSHSSVKNHLVFEYALSALGSAFDKSLISEEYFKFLKQFSLLEDHTTWAFFFNNYRIKRINYDHVIMLHRTDMNSVQHNPKYTRIVNEDRIQLNAYQRSIIKNPFLKLFLKINDKELREEDLNTLFKKSNVLRLVYKLPHMIFCYIFTRKKIEAIFIEECSEMRPYLKQIRVNAKAFIDSIKMSFEIIE